MLFLTAGVFGQGVQNVERTLVHESYKSFKPCEKIFVDKGATLIHGSYHGDVYIASGGVAILKGSNTKAYVEKGAMVILEDGLDQKVYFENGAIILNRMPHKYNKFYRLNSRAELGESLSSIED